MFALYVTGGLDLSKAVEIDKVLRAYRAEDLTWVEAVNELRALGASRRDAETLLKPMNMR